jgi:hypothetical protein
MFNTYVGAGAVRTGAASHYGSGSDQLMLLLATPASQHCINLIETSSFWLLWGKPILSPFLNVLVKAAEVMVEG